MPKHYVVRFSYPSDDGKRFQSFHVLCSAELRECIMARLLVLGNKGVIENCTVNLVSQIEPMTFAAFGRKFNSLFAGEIHDTPTLEFK